MLLDKARQYAVRVIDCEEITTKEVTIQCKWFLEDLDKNQYDDDFPYYFDEDFLKKVEGIFKLIKYATGINVVGSSIMDSMQGFQAFFFANIFGWKFKSEPTKYRYRDVVLFISRKNSKTFLCALIFIVLMLTEDKFSEFYSICIDRELAGEVKKAMRQLIEGSPAISKYFVIPKSLHGKVVCKVTNSFYQPRTAEASRNNAIRPSAIVVDEIGSFKDYSNINALQSGMLSVRNPLRFKLTTAYALDQSIMLEELAYIKKVYSGAIKDDRLFALLYYAEPEHLWTDFGMMQANPLRVEENYNEIRENRRKAIEKPLEREEYLTKHCNHFLPTNSGEAYVELEDLRKCKIDSFDWTNRDVWIGLDFALSNDNCSYTMITEEDLKIFCDSFAFLPKDKIEEKSRYEKIDYNEFIKQGKAYACGDLVIDYMFIEDMVLAIEQTHKVNIMGIAYDPWNCRSSAQRFEKMGFKTVECKQHSSILHPPTKLIRELILKQEFFYVENPLLEINFVNCKIVEDNNKNIFINKKKSSGKVDMCASLVNATWLLMQDVHFNPEGDWAIQVI